MKNNKSEYTKLKSKIYLRFFVLTLIAVVIIFVLYRLFWHKRGGDLLIDFLCRVMNMNYYKAYDFYQQYFRNYSEIIWVIAIAIIFIIMLRCFLNWFTQYFTAINKGIDILLVDDDIGIRLLPEMEATEQKLNTVKRTLKQRALAAQVAEQRKNDLITYLAHDIHTPLTSVIGYLSLLNECPDLPPEQRAKYLNITLEKSIQLEKLINEFFEITKYNLQQIQLNKENTDIYYMLLQLTDEFYPVLKEHGNSIDLCADENLVGNVDAEKLARVFNNIIKNAIAYSYSDTVIKIVAKNVDNHINISFSSTGKTIPQEKLESIFEKFFRVDESRTSNTGGTGLGLAIAKEIVTLHGGTIKATSDNEITVFTVNIPI